MRKFEKVSYNQFEKDMINTFGHNYMGGGYEEIYDAITLPRRATAKSGGYDFVSPISFSLKPNEDIKIPTGIKVNLEYCDFLLIVPRSGSGFKYYVRLANTVGIGDADYTNNPSNEGHYWVKIRNEGDKDFVVNAGDKICQGIILPYIITDDDNPVENDRVGGLGSTD